MLLNVIFHDILLLTMEEILRGLKNMDFPRFSGHTEKFDIISNLEVCYGRTEGTKTIRSGI